jgi:hypothetical protein
MAAGMRTKEALQSNLQSVYRAFAENLQSICKELQSTHLELGEDVVDHLSVGLH